MYVGSEMVFQNFTGGSTVWNAALSGGSFCIPLLRSRLVRRCGGASSVRDWMVLFRNSALCIVLYWRNGCLVQENAEG